MVLFSARATWLAAALAFFASVAAHAAISDCEELKRASIKEHLDRCVAHAACNFVLASKPDCAEGVRFLERTKGNALSQLTSLFNRNKALSTNDVYEANLPEVDHPQDWKDRFAAMRDKVAQSGTEVLSGKLDDGSTWLYQGDVQDGKRQGWGVFFWAGGEMHRGEFAQNWRTGQGEYSAPNGYRAVGMYENNFLSGEAWERLRDGARKKGNYAKGKLEGAGSFVFPDGDSYTGNFIGNDFNGRGTFRWKSGASFEGNFTNDKMDGQGTYTSTSGDRSPRTYNAGTLVASAAPAAAAPVTPAAAPVSPTAACERSHTTCSAICIAGGLAAMLSRSRYDTTACTDSCKSSQQQCLAALAPAPVVAAAPGVAIPSPSSSGGGMVGETHFAELPPPGNARSRNECLILEWAWRPLPASKAADTRLTNPQYFGTSSDGRTVEQRVLVAYNKCGEDLLVIAFGCEEDTMLSRGRQGNESWIAGEHTGTSFGSARAHVIKDVRLFVGSGSVAKNVYGSDKRHRVVQVYYGAWLRTDLYNADGTSNTNAMSLDRKITALNRKSNEVLNRPLETSTLFYNQGNSSTFPTSSWRARGVKPCSSFLGQSTWEGTL